MSAVITPFKGTELFNTASFNNRISQINTGFSYVSNPNLLDNWYFGRPVNQRGQTSWVNPSDWQYAIDRWLITPSSVIALVDGGITITADFDQGLEKDRLEFGRTYTFSVLSSDGRLGKHTFVLTSDPNINVNFGFGYFVCYLSKGNMWFRIYGDGSTYKAAKLELGSQQTLAHQDADGNWVLNEVPDYGEQLRRCQRYCRVYKAGEYLPCLAYPESDGWYLSASMYIGNMRTTPINNFGNGLSCSVSNIDAGTSIDKTILNWGIVGSTIQRLRINGGDKTPGPFPYNVMPKQDIIFSADL